MSVFAFMWIFTVLSAWLDAIYVRKTFRYLFPNVYSRTMPRNSASGSKENRWVKLCLFLHDFQLRVLIFCPSVWPGVPLSTFLKSIHIWPFRQSVRQSVRQFVRRQKSIKKCKNKQTKKRKLEPEFQAQIPTLSLNHNNKNTTTIMTTITETTTTEFLHE